MKLNLERPLIVFDLEATGMNIISDRIIMLAYIKIFPSGNQESSTYYINPECHIPEESTAIHHITDADVKDSPTFRELAPKLNEIFTGCDLAGFNSNHFDVPMFVEEMLKAGINFDISHVELVDVQNIYHKLEPRNLSAAYKYYCGKDLKDAHSASADARATYEVLLAQLDKYPDVLKNDVASLSEFSKMNDNVDLAGRMVYNDKHEIVFNFGKYKGVPVGNVLRNDPGYFGWILRGEFPQNTKQVLMAIQMKLNGNR